MSLAPGDRLAHFTIHSLIGKGGMGEVYRARDTRLDREVAIKISAEQFSERFDREARVVASLNHPNICALYDVGPNYLVMELIEGESPKGPLPLATVLDYAKQLAAALDAAHEKGITHRDLKPGNLKVYCGWKAEGAGFRSRQAGNAGPGSPARSFSDDCFRRNPGRNDSRYRGVHVARAGERQSGGQARDIWAFGVVLYELIPAKRCFTETM
jgi:serine/threonine protein kinase